MASLRPNRWAYSLLGLCFLLLLTRPWVVLASQVDPLSSQTVTLADYRALLAESRALVERDDSLADFPALANRWESITAVMMTRDDGVVLIMPVQHTYIVSLLRADVPNFGQLRRTFAALDNVAATWPVAPAPISPPEFATELTALENVLASPAFQATPDEPNLVERIRRQVLNVLNDFLARFWPQDVDVAGGGWFFTVVLPLVLGVALTLVIMLAIRRLTTDFVTTTAVDENDWATGEPLTSATAYQQAQTNSQAGDYRTAVRYLYLSTLLALDERDILRYDRSATNREYLRRVADQPDLHHLLRDVVDVFDRVWYGFQPISHDTYDTYAERVAALQKTRRRVRQEPDA